jgi:hypothetical protein
MNSFITSLTLFFVFFFSNILFGQIQNIKISSQFEPEEVSIAVNPKNTKQIIAGANLSSSYYSHDGGFTWQRNGLTCKEFNVYIS